MGWLDREWFGFGGDWAVRNWSVRQFGWSLDIFVSGFFCEWLARLICRLVIIVGWLPFQPLVVFGRHGRLSLALMGDCWTKNSCQFLPCGSC